MLHTAVDEIVVKKRFTRYDAYLKKPLEDNALAITVDGLLQ